MRVLFNCTTNVVGGGVKNSALFIMNARDYPGIDWLFAVSPPVYEIIKAWDITNDKRILVFATSPARDISTRKNLESLCRERNVDLVYTMAGPAYVRFPTFHIMGISNPYITHGDYQAFTIRKNLFFIARQLFTIIYQSYYSRFADAWLFQTETARNGYIKRFKIGRDATYVVTNSIGDEFVASFSTIPTKAISLNKTVNIFCPAAAYWHKGLSLIPEIAAELRKQTQAMYEFKFIFTLEHDSDLWREISRLATLLRVDTNIDNIGPYNYTKAASLFQRYDLVFVPSILETFSASYLEAFASKKPLVTADKNFARAICKDAAVYINPFNSRKTARAIDDVILNKKKQLDLIEKGLNVLSEYGSQSERIMKIIHYLRSCSTNRQS